MTAIYFAGAEVETLTRALMDAKVKHVLYSFYYINQMNRYRFIEEMQDAFPDVSWILDSGAFTYYAKFRSEPEKLMPVEQYRRRYFSYIDATWERWDRIAELDLDDAPALVPTDIALQVLADWREEMLDRWPTAPIMPVWHGSRGLAEWTLYCRDPRYRYLAIGSGLGKQFIGFIRGLINEAHQWNKLVHGFGMTRVNTMLPSLPYDTVDSTSWLMGQKFGTMFIFKDNIFRLVGKDAGMGKRERRKYRRHFTAHGLDYKLIEKDDVAEVRRANISAWKRLSERLQAIRTYQNRTLNHIDPETMGVLRGVHASPALLREQRPLPGGDTYYRPRDLDSVVSAAKERVDEARGAAKERDDDEEIKPAAKKRPDSED